MVRRIRCLLLALLVGGFLICPVFAATVFPDVDENAEYAEAIEILNDLGILQGNPDGKFYPNDNVTRAQLAAILCRSLGETDDSSINSELFSDVPGSHWANGYITKIASLDIISGYTDGTFRPHQALTREELALILVRLDDAKYFPSA